MWNFAAGTEQPSALERIARTLNAFYTKNDFSDLDPGYSKYFKRLQTIKGAEKYVRHIQNVFKIAGTSIQGQRILDAGCGYGMAALVLKMLGAKEVIGIDIKKQRLNSFRKVLTQLSMTDQRISALCMSVTDMAFQDSSFDSILVNEAISHYNGLLPFFSQVRRVLKPGGVLIIADGNNALNPLIKRANYKLWETYEHGPDGISIFGHRIEKSLTTQRREIIAKQFPTLSREEVDMLAKRTSGLWGEHLIDAVHRYIHSGELPQFIYQKGRCPRNPSIGSLVEMAINPFELKRTIAQLGFSVRVYSHFFGARNNLLFRMNQLLATLTPLTIYTARAFRIVAKKR